MSKSRGRKPPPSLFGNNVGRNLSPIREMSGIVPVQVVPKGTKVMKGTAGHAPILVQSLPPEVKEVKPKMKPNERHYNDVDQIVSDYLHYARYGQVAPVLPESGVGGLGGGAGLRCPCCVDRNRENVMKRMALQRGLEPASLGEITAKDLPEHHQTNPVPGPSSADDPPRPPTKRAPAGPQQSPRHAPRPWAYYQPTPYAGTFLNPEFNRPFVMQTASEDAFKLSSEENFIYDKVLQADSEFDLSMTKLKSHYQSRFEVPGDSIALDENSENPYD